MTLLVAAVNKEKRVILFEGGAKEKVKASITFLFFADSLNRFITLKQDNN
jgi:hypothetical protein